MTKEWQAFPVKGQIVNLLGSAARMIFIATPPLWKQLWARQCSNTSLFTKTSGGAEGAHGPAFHTSVSWSTLSNREFSLRSDFPVLSGHTWKLQDLNSWCTGFQRMNPITQQPVLNLKGV